MINTLVAIDIGYGYTKALAGEKFVRFPSVQGVAQDIAYDGHVLDDNHKSNGIHLMTPHGGRFVGDLALRQASVAWNAQDWGRTERDDMLVFTLAALSELEVTGDVSLVTGLPVKRYKPDAEKLRKQLTGQHIIWRAGRPEVKINIVEVLPTIQPFGSLFSLIFNEAGKIINPGLASGKVGIIDIGMFTTDFIVAERGEYLETGSGSITTAMGSVYELLAREIETQFDYAISIHDTDQALRAGKLKVRGHTHDLAELADPILSGVSNDILSAIAKKWRNLANGLDDIFVVGGGNSTIGPYLCDTFPHIEILPGGDKTNVKGYHYYGLFKQRRARGNTAAKAKATNGKVKA